MPTAATFTQVTFRLRNDNGSESGATWIAVEGGDATLNVDTNYRCRFLIQESTPKSSTPDFKLMYSLNNGTYAYAASGQPVKPVTSTYFTDGDDCTNQLTGGSGTFHSDNNGMDSDGIVDAGIFPGGYYLELEYCFQIDSNYVANNDNIKLRAYASDLISHYYSDIPSITVSEGGGSQSLTLTCAAGSYAQTGTAATLTYTKAAQNLTLACNAGSYALTGTNADLTVKRNYVLACEAGTYTITGTAATFEVKRNYTLACGAGSFTLTGSNVDLIVQHNYVLTLESGSYTLIGSDVTLDVLSLIINRIMYYRRLMSR